MVRQMISVTPTVDTSAYGSGDRLGSIQTLTGACEVAGKAAVLESVTIVDKSNQKAAMTLLFFESLPTVASSDNTALDISDAQMAKCVGVVSIANTDYADASSSAAGCKTFDLPMRSAGAADLYVVVKSGGTPTYGAATDLTFKYVFRQD